MTDTLEALKSARVAMGGAWLEMEGAADVHSCKECLKGAKAAADACGDLDAAIAAAEADMETREALDKQCLDWMGYFESGDNRFNCPNDVSEAAYKRGRFLASRGEGKADAGSQ